MSGRKKSPKPKKPPAKPSEAIANTRPEVGDLPAPVPPEAPKNISQVTLRTQRMVAWSSPLPPPEELAKYEEVVPGFSAELLSGWKAEQLHRRGMEGREMTLDERDQRDETRITTLGVVCTTTVSLSLIVAACYAISKGQSIAAVLIAVAEMAALVAAYIFGRKSGPPTDP